MKRINFIISIICHLMILSVAIIIFIFVNKLPKADNTGTNKNETFNSEIQNPYYGTKSNNEKTVYTVYKVNLDEWVSDFPKFTNDLNVGSITNPFDAAEIAERLWKEHLGEDRYKEYEQGTQKRILYDTDKKCWWVIALFTEDYFGSVPNALVEDDGDVLAVWIG